MSETLPEVVAAVGVEALPAVVAAADPNKNPYWTYLDSLDNAESRRTMKGCLDRIARLIAGADPAGVDRVTGKPDPAALAITGETVHWHLLRAEHTQHIRALIAAATTRKKDADPEPWSTAYRNKHIVALRQVLDRAWLLGLMNADERDRAQRVDQFAGTRLPKGKHLPVERVGALFAACDADPEDVEDDAHRERLRRTALRDAALLAALYSTGARRSELAGVALADYDPADRSLRIRHGKRNKERYVYLTSSAVSRIEAWLTVRGSDPGGLFAPFTPRGGHVRRTRAGTVAHMSGQTVGDVIANRAEQAGLAEAPDAHDFRRTFTGELLDAGVDLATAQALLGHASPATTARYDRRPERARRAAVDKLRTPEATPLPGVGRRRGNAT
ncbi:site-specific recombinase XerD [Nonomuraea muscovyensis]|uniref:Site-specific recombinase XerD n=1 Tax=Nonomuraea muscovyensis TaxID=1124761 RepID=A0A7X0C2A7_9ACTN|nr:tyrosine-type recombinase/integrase [Nonomuraea muscovyensis]MBB6347217.1 site-specific recombinase XerD [Nonomuraea muscovyensis]